MQLFNEITPLEFLKIRNNNINPSSYDVELIGKIRVSTELSDPVINVLLDYSLEKLDNKLIPSYVEKVAASLSRKGIKDAYEAMLYLNGKTVKEVRKEEVKVSAPVKKNIEEEPLNEEFKWW